MKDRLFLLREPFQDGGFDWYCNDCATLEAAMRINAAYWSDKVDIVHVDFQRPRKPVIDLVGEQYQGLPMLVMDAERSPGDAIRVGDYAILQDVRAIGRALASRHGGAGPHP